ncbi:MAG: hypothetical protein ACR2N0_15820 [Rubrobacteraceae bacterium]|nr:hypothetical protein [Rubrobacter sp.]
MNNSGRAARRFVKSREMPCLHRATSAAIVVVKETISRNPYHSDRARLRSDTANDDEVGRNGVGGESPTLGKREGGERIWIEVTENAVSAEAVAKGMPMSAA